MKIYAFSFTVILTCQLFKDHCYKYAPGCLKIVFFSLHIPLRIIKWDIYHYEDVLNSWFFVTYLATNIIDEMYITKRQWYEISIIFCLKNFLSYFIENFQGQNNFWFQHFWYLQLICFFFLVISLFASRKIWHPNSRILKIQLLFYHNFFCDII